MARTLVLVFGLLSLAGAARADEGMWTFDAVPQARFEQATGVKYDQAFIDRLRLASVRLSSGCSASLVSHEGLALTNAHCLLGCLESLSAPGRDYVAGGFLTDSRAEERPCPGLAAEVLVGIVDATEAIKAASPAPGRAGFVFDRERAIAKAEHDACGRDARLRCQAISFFGGGQFKVYKYRRYDDVRLVFAPEFATAFLGGDADNFRFPRYDLDCAFVRLYERGRPAVTPAALTWTRAAPAIGEAVFVSGNPGVTERGAAVVQLEADRDVGLPAQEASLEATKTRLLKFAAGGAEKARQVAERLFETENALKLVRGRRAALAAPGLIETRRAEEATLRAKIAADPKLEASFGGAWTEAEGAATARASLEAPWRALEAEAGGGSQLLAWARMLVRAAAERAKPPPARLPEYANSRLALDRKAVVDGRPVSPALEAELIAVWLERCREVLGPDSPDLPVLLRGQSPEVLARNLVSGSRLADPAVRRALWRGGLAAVSASRDPLIVYAAAIDPLARAARRAYEDEVIGPEQRASEAIARARLAVGGDNLYPDATFSLRLSFGRVEGWSAGEARVAPFTTLAGLYARADDADPLPARWLAARAGLDETTVLDFVTTNDITGGSSGSPVVDARGQIVGAAFDGNAASIAGDFAYDGAVNRTVAVSTAAITVALDKVYGRKALLAELEGG